MNTKLLTGRISRGGYFATFFGTTMVIQLLGGIADNVPFFEFIFFLPMGVSIFLYVVFFSILSVKRLHDINVNGLYVLVFLGLIIAVGFIPVAGYILSAGMLSLIALLLSLKKGTVGPNRFGEDPVYRKGTTTPS